MSSISSPSTYTYKDSGTESFSTTPRGPTRGWNVNATLTCHIHWDRSQWSPQRYLQIVPVYSIPSSSWQNIDRYLIPDTGIFLVPLSPPLEYSPDPSLLGNPWPGYLSQASAYASIRIVHEGLAEAQKAGTTFFPSGPDTGRVFAVSQHILPHKIINRWLELYCSTSY